MHMARASWNGATLAESDKVQIVDGYVYFPPDSVDDELLRPSDKRSTCWWKGSASYFDVVVGDAVNRDAGWVYSDPKPKADNIRGYIAFWRGVDVER